MLLHHCYGSQRLSQRFISCTFEQYANFLDSSFSGGRSLREVTLSEPIRYAKGDGVEKWLNNVLCLDATLPRSKLNTLQGCPDPSQCQLLNVNRDTLFSFHEVSEKFLQQMVALYVARYVIPEIHVSTFLAMLNRLLMS
jgi:tRNA(Met) C34 N-acetyltransferase TmcA